MEDADLKRLVDRTAMKSKLNEMGIQLSCQEEIQDNIDNIITSVCDNMRKNDQVRKFPSSDEIKEVLNAI